MRTLGTVLLAGTLLNLALGCGGRSSAAPPTRVTLTDSDFGHVVTVAVGEAFTVALDENPTTGYSWRCTWDPTARLELASDTYTPDPAPHGMVGSGGTRYFALKALTSGDVIISLQYGRWWEGGEKQAPQTITVHVTE